MGNAPSVTKLPPEWEDILPNITREDIVCSSRKKCRLEEGNCVYLDEDMFDLDEHVPVAMAVLRAHPQLKDVRFNLVPGKMTEENFWAAVFGILNDGGIDMEDVVGAIEDDYLPGDEADGSKETGEGENLLSPLAQRLKSKAQSAEKESGNSVRSPIVHLEQTYSDSDDALAPTTTALLEEIEAQQVRIARLQKSLREANHKTRKLALELNKARKKHHDGGTHVTSCNEEVSLLRTPKRPHKGSWEIDSDCSEFMKLDACLKENLRQEKKKRLNEVLSQMKFILDSDEIKDSYGKWSCCGRETYDTEGCA